MRLWRWLRRSCSKKERSRRCRLLETQRITKIQSPTHTVCGSRECLVHALLEEEHFRDRKPSTVPLFAQRLIVAISWDAGYHSVDGPAHECECTVEIGLGGMIFQRPVCPPHSRRKTWKYPPHSKWFFEGVERYDTSLLCVDRAYTL